MKAWSGVPIVSPIVHSFVTVFTATSLSRHPLSKAIAFTVQLPVM